MPPGTSSTVEEFARVTHILTGALAGAVIVYMVIAWLVAPTVSEAAGDPEFVRLLAGILAVVAAGQLVGARWYFAIQVRAAEQQTTPERRLGRYRVALIVAFALREGVALYGLVLSFLSGDPRWALGFGAVALFSMALGWPKRSKMERLASETPPIG
jgi:hypothetical protein